MAQKMREEMSWRHWSKWFGWLWVFSRHWVNSLPRFSLTLQLSCNADCPLIKKKKKNHHLMSVWYKPDAIKSILIPFSYLPLPLKPKWVLSVFASRSTRCHHGLELFAVVPKTLFALDLWGQTWVQILGWIFTGVIDKILCSSISPCTKERIMAAPL